MKHTIVIGLCVAGFTFASCDSTPKLNENNIDDIIAAMTLEEKAHLVVGTGMAGFSGDSAVVGETKALVPGAAGTTYPIARLGIPAVVLADGPAGLRINPTREGDSATYYCTHFPIGTLLASTWDTALVEEVGQAIGNEVLEYGADVLLAPALNIHRNPLCGRNFEYYSEDPIVAGKIAAAYVQGVQSQGVGTSIKHFAVNNQESNRMGNDARLSQRALREIYLKGFEIAVKESNPWTVMSSYNYINGTYASESSDLLTTVLRDDWSYPGMVMTDWYGGKDAIAQMTAGNDMLQPGTDKQYQAIIDGVKSGALDEKILDRNVRRILEMIVKTPHFRGYEFSNSPDLKAHALITRRSATDGMVLLKNDKGTLPISTDTKKVALFGCTSYDFIAGGTGSGNVNRAYTVSLLDGMKNAGFSLNPDLQKKYETHLEAEKIRLTPDTAAELSSFMPQPRPEELKFTKAELMDLARNNDIAIITIGRTSGEFLDRTVNDFNLKASEIELIKNTCDAFHALGKRAVVILNIGGVIETASWKQYPDAILCAWQAGQEGGNSVADVLTGKANPSGKLTMTFPIAYADHASSANFPVNGASSEFGAERKDGGNTPLWDFTPYNEDIYIGYRFFDTFDKEVSYPFGYGLSYTQFEYSSPRMSEKDGIFTISVDIKNIGKNAGKEVVQLYISAPDAKTSNKPEHELKAFAKTRLLAPGESETVNLTVNSSDLASFSADKSAWIVDEGTYTFAIGASSRDIKCTLTAATPAKTIPVNPALAPKSDLQLLKR